MEEGEVQALNNEVDRLSLDADRGEEVQNNAAPPGMTAGMLAEFTAMQAKLAKMEEEKQLQAAELAALKARQDEREEKDRAVSSRSAVKMAKPSDFVGSGDVSSWVSEVSDYLGFNNVPEKDRYPLALSFVKGKARTMVLNAARGTAPTSLTFTWLTEVLIRYFDTQDKETKGRDDLRKLKAGKGPAKTVREIATKLTDALANIPSRAQPHAKDDNIADFLECVRPEIRAAIKVHKRSFADLQEVIQVALQVESALKAPQEGSAVEGDGEATGSAKRTGSGSWQTKSYKKQKSNKGEGIVRLDKSEWAKLSPEEKEHRKKNNLCYKCGGAGHNATNCTNKPNAEHAAVPDRKGKGKAN
jgi:hypothetical protein